MKINSQVRFQRIKSFKIEVERSLILLIKIQLFLVKYIYKI